MSTASRRLMVGLVFAFPSPLQLLAQDSLAEYSVKFACGRRVQATTSAAVFEAVAPGRYFTAINIRNASADTARIRVQIATTRAAPVPGRLIELPSVALLPPRLALELDCRELLGAVQPPVSQSSALLKGFVVLTTDRDIDVVAVYSAGPGPAVETMDVERVAGRRRDTRAVRPGP